MNYANDYALKHAERILKIENEDERKKQLCAELNRFFRLGQEAVFSKIKVALVEADKKQAPGF